MNRIVRIIIIVLTCLMFAHVSPVGGQEKQEESGRTGGRGEWWIDKYQGRTVNARQDLRTIVKNHETWIKTHKEAGKQAILRGANLSGANLQRANLSGAILQRANLSGAKLNGAKLRGAILQSANLSNAGLASTDLSEADLNLSNLSGAYLGGAKLHRAKLYEANLCGACLRAAKLHRANLMGADLSGADLTEAYLIGAILQRANLSGANLSGANLQRANLRGAILSNAGLASTDLSEADLNLSNLSGAYLGGAILRGADLSGADLKNCHLDNVLQFPLIYEPKPGSTPYIPSIAKFPDLEKLYFLESPHGLVDLREGFKKFGYRKQEREITYALKYTQRRKLWNDKKSTIWDRLEGLSYLLFFELTCQYGMNPGRPLLILMGLIPSFSFFYLFALGTKRQKTGIWLIFLKGRILKTGGERPFKLTAKFPPRALPNGKLRKIKLKMLRWYRAIRIALYFSMLSAFSIGWRELNVGNWITRLQRREYFLRGTGWVRTVSGIQSLSSVYLLALWVLTYFGRPFEAV